MREFSLSISNHGRINALSYFFLRRKNRQFMSVTFYLSVRIYWSILDGAECNRQFIKMHFPEKDPVPAHFTTFNPHTGGEMGL